MLSPSLSAPPQGLERREQRCGRSSAARYGRGSCSPQGRTDGDGSAIDSNDAPRHGQRWSISVTCKSPAAARADDSGQAP